MIGILTFLNVLNYGAVLQAYALQEQLKSLGCEVRVINYLDTYTEWVYSKKKVFNGTPSGFRNYIRFLVNKLSFVVKKNSFQRFIENHIQVTRPLYDITDLATLNGSFDGFILGSDQVFNEKCTNLDPAYFLCFVEDDGKKNTYAASFGSGEVTPRYQSYYRTMLSSFNRFSVRENFGKSLIENLLDREVDTNIDPVFLLGGNEWRSRFMSSLKPHGRRSIVVYAVGRHKDLVSKAHELQKTTGLNVIWLVDNPQLLLRTMTKRKEKYRFCASPEEFLSYIADAEFVLTNSFHGTAFSIIFQKKFLVETETKLGTNYRVIELLESTGMSDRVLGSSDIMQISDTVDFSRGQAYIEDQRAKASDYLLSICTTD